jgi:hypothetical protein
VIYGSDSGNRIFVLYWRCPLIRVSVIRGSTVHCFNQHEFTFSISPYGNKKQHAYLLLCKDSLISLILELL